MQEEETNYLPPVNPKFEALLQQPRINLTDYNALTQDEKGAFLLQVSTELSLLTGEARDEFEYKIDPILHPESKRQIWENNHIMIKIALENHVKQFGSMPTRTQLAAMTGISRQSIGEHIKAFEKNEHYHAQQEQHKIASEQLLDAVLQKAFKGDMRAAQMYFNLTKPKTAPATTGKRTVVQNQNNYIQINNTVLSQDKLNQLTPEQLTAIEGIINAQLQLPVVQEHE